MMAYNKVKLGQLSIHGHSRANPKWFNIIVFSLSACFGLWQITGTFQKYLSNATKTTVSAPEIGKFPFPAITLCHGAVYDKSGVGNLPLVYIGGYAVTNGFDKMAETTRIATELCKSPNAAQNLTVDFFNADFSREIFFNDRKSVKECRFNGNVFNCSKSFLNRQTDVGFCFTFNAGATVINQRINKLSNLQDSYGTTANDSYVDFSMGNGRHNSISFLLDANVSQNCIQRVADSPGFAVLVHSPNYEPFISSKPIGVLPVGFATEVEIHFETFQRNTEHMGRCVRQLNLKWFPDMPDYTDRDLYFVNCITNIAVEKCGCTPYFTPQALFLRGLTNISWCISTANSQDQPVCLANALNREYLVDRKCFKKVPLPCKEVHMRTTSFTSEFPSPNYFSSLQRNLVETKDMQLAEFRQNFLLATFYVSDTRMTLIEEDPKMTWVDLVNQCGGTLGMCMGMSLISIVELIVILPYYLLTHLLPNCGKMFAPTEYFHYKYIP